MKKMIALWLSYGALAASAALNVYHARKGPETVVTCGVGDAAGAKSCQPYCRLVETVDLTTAQKRRFTDCCPSYTQRQVQLNQRVEVLVAELERGLCAVDPNTDRIHQLADEIEKARSEELRGRIDTILMVRKTLTPGQLERLSNCCGPK